MIRLPDALVQIETAIEEEAADWLKRAAERTKLFAELGGYAEEYTDPAGTTEKLTPFWSEVKPIYMRRQHNKCVYCETKLEGGTFATIQWDLEHFRPKSRARKWPGRKLRYTYDFATGDDSAAGYYLLAYHRHNYAAACKTCNTSFKSDYFPIAAARIAGKPHPKDYAAEEPFLVYPLGTDDEDPEDLITFDGVEAIPKHVKDQDTHKWRRARIMIDFFDLNRDGLVASRASWLLNTVWPNVKLADSGDPEWQEALKEFCSERAPFTSCAKCFVALCATDRPKAEAQVEEFRETVKSMDS